MVGILSTRNSAERWSLTGPHSGLASCRRILQRAARPRENSVEISLHTIRVVPELIFDTGIGELFVIRVAGHVGNTSTLAIYRLATGEVGCL